MILDGTKDKMVVIGYYNLTIFYSVFLILPRLCCGILYECLILPETEWLSAAYFGNVS